MKGTPQLRDVIGPITKSAHEGLLLLYYNYYYYRRPHYPAVVYFN